LKDWIHSIGSCRQDHSRRIKTSILGGRERDEEENCTAIEEREREGREGTRAKQRKYPT
jgi:hypothetical protein